MQTKHGAVQSVNENLQRITNASENVSAETLPLLYVQGMPDNQRVFPQYLLKMHYHHVDSAFLHT